MGGQPFMYDAMPNESFKHPYGRFDPRAASKASLMTKSEKPARNGPLVSFNRHPDSYIIAPYGNINAEPMSRSTKKRITWTRIVVLALRILQLLGAVGLLIMMILITGVTTLMRIVPGFAILHILYGIYHLSRRPTGRTPASSGSYMLFAAGADASIIPFYAFTSIIAYSQYHMALAGTNQDDQWDTILSNGSKYMVSFTGTAFFCPTIAACLHLVSLGLSLWLAMAFRKITSLPPDMNPLEDNLTSRSKGKKSSSSVPTTSEKRLPEPLDSKRNSGGPYEEVSSPPTIPFFHTRTQSSDSFSTYDSRLDLPSWKHQSSSSMKSSRTAFSDLKRSSLVTPTGRSKRGSYVEIPCAERSSEVSNTNQVDLKDAWFTSDILDGKTSPRRGNASPRKPSYQPIHQHRDSMDMEDLSMTLMNAFINPLGDESSPKVPINPLASHPTRSKHQSALAEISPNRDSTGDLADTARHLKRYTTGNLTDVHRNLNLNLNRNTSDVADMSLNPSLNDLDPRKQNLVRPGQQAPSRKPSSQEENFKIKSYGELTPGTAPVLVGKGGGLRQTSTGNDYAAKGSLRTYDRKSSIKTGEEGRSEPGVGGLGPRMRKTSGMGV